MNKIGQAVQDWFDRRGLKRIARRIFHARVRWYVWRGRVVGARTVGGEDR